MAPQKGLKVKNRGSNVSTDDEKTEKSDLSSKEITDAIMNRRTGISRRLDETDWRKSLDRREDWELRNAIGKVLSDEDRDLLRQRVGKARSLPIDRRIGPRNLYGDTER